jgi:hypothetical protein
VMMPAMDRIHAEIINGVVHPPHIPFVAEAKSAAVHWT